MIMVNIVGDNDNNKHTHTDTDNHTIVNYLSTIFFFGHPFSGYYYFFFHYKNKPMTIDDID